MADGKMILKGTIELLSPTLIGSGRDDYTGIDVLFDTDQNSEIDVLLDDRQIPFIPATSFLGVLKHHIHLSDQYRDQRKRFWGFIREEKISDQELEKQSTIRCSDLRCLNPKRVKIAVRDGIRIDHTTGIVEETGKYDYQVIERGARFAFSLEADYIKADKEFTERMITTICHELEQGKIHIGAKTNNGLGQIILVDKNFYCFDLSDKTDVLTWLKAQHTQHSPEPIPLPTNPFPIQPSYFSINAVFDLKSSLIIRSYSSSPGMPDAVHLKSAGRDVIAGSSLKGAIRARAERILKTLANKEAVANQILIELFGHVDEKNRSKKSRKGKFRVGEVLLSKCISELHRRIKIDRFTGGTIEGALFETMPVYTNFTDKVKHVTMTIRDYQDYEAGLLLLVLKDLWTGDLAIGGEKSVGRGILQGWYADIAWDGQEKAIHLERDLSLRPEDETRLRSLVNALASYIEQKEKNHAK